MRAIGGFDLLARTLGDREALRVERQLRRHANPIRFNYDGRGLAMWNDRAARYHLTESLPKLRRLAEFVPRDAGVVVDVGAHSGLFAALVQNRAPEARIVCVEPNPSLVPVIEENLCGRFDVVCAAVGDGKSSTAVFHVSHVSTQTSSVVRSSVDVFDEAAEPIEVRAVGLDEVCADLDWVDVLKVDVQGAEWSVLHAAEETLAKVSILLVEVAFVDPHPVRLVEFLCEMFGEWQVVNPVYAGADLAFVRHS